MIAAAKGMSHVVDHMIKFKVNVNHVNLKGQTALISALRFNNEDIVVSLIAAGTDLNSRDADGHTPLYYAESVVITELIRRGARYSKQIKKKQIKKRKKKLAYEKNILTDEKDVVPTSYHVYVFSFMTLVAVLILIYYYVIN
jgi:ankyrin repeat protein